MKNQWQMPLKQEFSKRLNEALDDLPDSTRPPAKHYGRQIAVAKLFGVTQKATAKWLEGDGFPELAMSIRIATFCNVSLEWLLTGRGQKRIMEPTSALLAELLDCWYRLPEAAQAELVTFAKYVADKVSVKPYPQNQDKIHKPH